MVRSIHEMLNLEVFLVTLSIMAATWLVLLGVNRLFVVLAEKFPRHRVTISSAFPVLRLAVWIAVIVFIISGVIEPEMSTLIALSATAGVALGLGAQETVKGALAGVLILIERPFRVGDMVRIDAHYGEVTRIGLRTTWIHTFNDSTVAVPNNILFDRAVVNSNSGSIVELVAVKFFLPAGVAVRKVKDLMLEAAACSPYVYRKNPLQVLVEDEYDRGFLTVFTVKAYVMDVRFEQMMASDITERVKEGLAERGLPREIYSEPAIV
ncbi:MAG: mechanosensitive ion channel [Proteobacteria bacterium]|nr:mechanosensitive ion channel [Pseudomonadota bacterium]